MLDNISNVVWIVGLIRMADRVLKISRGSIVNISGDNGVPDNEVVSDAVKVHDDSGELHTKTGIYIYMVGAMAYIRIWGHAQYVHVGATVQYDSSWCDDAQAEGRLL